MEKKGIRSDTATKVADLKDFTRKAIETLPPDERPWAATAVSAYLVEVAGYELAQQGNQARVVDLILTAANLERWGTELHDGGPTYAAGAAHGTGKLRH